MIGFYPLICQFQSAEFVWYLWQFRVSRVHYTYPLYQHKMMLTMQGPVYSSSPLFEDLQ